MQRPGSWRVAIATIVSTTVVLVPTLAAAQQASPADSGEPGMASDGFIGPSPSQMESPETQAEIQRALAEAQAERARLDRPAEGQARAESRDAYQRLGDQAARELAVAIFPDLFLLPTSQPFEVPPGYEVIKYGSQTTALVAPSATKEVDGPPGTPSTARGGDAAVVETMLPLRARTESGTLRPVSTDLIAEGDHFEAANPTTKAELPLDLTDGLALPSLGISLTPERAAQADDAVPLGADKVFYANIEPDTDFFAAPTQVGFESFWQLRSVDSPQELTLEVDMPAGAILRASEIADGAEIADGDQPLAVVAPPRAFDADGTAVPVTMAPDGDELRLTIEHRAGDYKYPIAVDPDVSEWHWWKEGAACPTSGVGGWRWEVWPSSNPMFPGCDASYGIYNDAPGWWNYGQNWYSQFVWAPPANTYISKLYFGEYQLEHSYSEHVCAWFGIWGSTGWQGGSVNTCSVFNLASQTFYAAGNTPDNTVAISQLYMPGENVRFSESWTAVRGFQVWVSDRHAPTASLGAPSGPYSGDAWVDDSLPGGAPATYSVNVSGSDVGLGMKRFWLGDVVGGWQSADQACTDFRNNACPASWTRSFNYQLDEGRRRVAYQSMDLVENYSAVSYGPWQRVDRSAPQFGSASGTLTEDDYFDVDVTATDGSTTSPALERSGVRRIEVSVDGELRYFDDQACPQGNCPMQSSWEIPTDEWKRGEHEVTVTAIDMLDHRATRTLTPSVEVNTSINSGPRGTVDQPNSAFSFSSPDDSSFQCQVDGQPWTACSSPFSTGNFADGVHAFSVRASNAGSTDPRPAERRWTIDTVSPQTVIDSSPTSPDSSGTATVSFSSPELGAQFECRWDRECFSPCVSPAARVGVRGGNHSFAVRAIDLAGHIDPSPAVTSWVSETQTTSQSCDPLAAALAQPAIQALQSNAPTVIGASQPGSSDGVTLDPSLAAPQNGTEAMQATGTLVSSVVPCDLRDGFRMETSWGMLSLAPTQVGISASEAALVNGDTAVFSDTSSGADTVLRPTAQGISALTQVRQSTASETYEWRLSMPGGVRTRVLADGSIAVLADTTPVSGQVDVDDGESAPPLADDGQLVLADQALIPPSADGSLVPPPNYVASGVLQAASGALGLRTAVPNVNQQLSTSASALNYAYNQVGSEGHLLLAVIKKPWAVDADGRSVPVGLSVNRDVITMTVDHAGAGYRYPIVADPDLVDCENRPNPCGNFEPAAAVAYAYKWRTGRNGNYLAFDNDCTNFLSQALKAGRMQFSREYEKGEGSWWSNKFDPHPWVDWTHSWSVASSLQHQLREYGLARVIPDGKRDYKPGDLLFYRWRDTPNVMSHANIVYSVAGGDSGMPYLLQHTSDYEEPKSLREFRRRARRGYGGVAGMVHLRPIHTRANVPG